MRFSVTVSRDVERDDTRVRVAEDAEPGTVTGVVTGGGVPRGKNAGRVGE